MKPERSFCAERTLARHCPELLDREAAPRDHGPALDRLSGKLADAFARALSAPAGGSAPRVAAQENRQTLAKDWLADTANGLAAHMVLTLGDGAMQLFASIEAAGLFSQFDRAFGGTGQVPSPLPGVFPLSAELFLPRLAQLVARAASEGLGHGRVATVHAHGAEPDLIAPWRAQEPLWLLRLLVEEDGGPAWSIGLALPEPLLEALCGDQAATGDAGSAPAAQRPDRGPCDAPFAGVPLTLAATLVDMKIPFSRLAALRCGDVLPVSVARCVPLAIGGQQIAAGTVGEVDDRVAIQITTCF